MRIENIDIRPVNGSKTKAVATVHFDNGCKMRDVRVLRVGTEYVVGVPWKSTDVRRCVKAGRLYKSAKKIVRDEVLDEYIIALAREET